jgi:hypothetical protein
MDWGNVAEWFAGLGAIFAAVTALNISGRDRRDRRRERMNAAFAQMRLVRIAAEPYEDSRTPDHTLRVHVTNYGQRPILQLRVYSAELFTQQDCGGVDVGVMDVPPASWDDRWIRHHGFIMNVTHIPRRASFELNRGTDRPVPLVMPVLPVATEQLKLTGVDGHPDGRFLVAVRHMDSNQPWSPRERPKFVVNVTIQCLDADGRRWMLQNAPVNPKRIPSVFSTKAPWWRKPNPFSRSILLEDRDLSLE